MTHAVGMTLLWYVNLHGLSAPCYIEAVAFAMRSRRSCAAEDAAWGIEPVEPGGAEGGADPCCGAGQAEEPGWRSIATDPGESAAAAGQVAATSEADRIATDADNTPKGS
jgi:hypothetical protein